MAAPAFRNEREDTHELEPYRSVSGLAICALILGVLSIAALAHPGAWIFPGFAILCGGLALVRITRQPDVLSGRHLATLGLMLGLFFGVWATSRYFSERWIVNRQARDFVEQWIQAVLDGELEAAHQATLPYYLREPEGTRLKEFYANNSEELQQMQEYFSDGMPKEVAALGKNGEFRFDRSMLVNRDPRSRVVGQRYFVYPQGGDPVLHLHVDVLMELRDDGVYWQLLGTDDAEILDRPRPY